jgi:hypothetical protein
MIIVKEERLLEADEKKKSCVWYSLYLLSESSYISRPSRSPRGVALLVATDLGCQHFARMGQIYAKWVVLMALGVFISVSYLNADEITGLRQVLYAAVVYR